MAAGMAWRRGGPSEGRHCDGNRQGRRAAGRRVAGGAFSCRVGMYISGSFFGTGGAPACARSSSSAFWPRLSVSASADCLGGPKPWPVVLAASSSRACATGRPNRPAGAVRRSADEPATRSASARRRLLDMAQPTWGVNAGRLRMQAYLATRRRVRGHQLLKYGPFSLLLKHARVR